MLQQFIHELEAKGSVQFYVRVVPNAPVTAITEVLADQSVKIKIAAQADHNKVNIALIRFLADKFGVPKDAVHIVSGITSRQKLLRIMRPRHN